LTGDGGASEHSDDAASDADEGSASSRWKEAGSAAAISTAASDARCADELHAASWALTLERRFLALASTARHGVRVEARRREATGLLFL
jgi:hypothetical protein